MASTPRGVPLVQVAVCTAGLARLVLQPTMDTPIYHGEVQRTAEAAKGTGEGCRVAHVHQQRSG